MNKLKIGLLSVIFFLLTACGQSSDSDTSNDFYVGVMSGPEEQLMEAAKKVAFQKYGLDIKVVTFSDYNMPNTALCEKKINANIFQHLPFLEQQMKNQPCELVPIAKTFVFPMGLYSRKITNLNQLENQAVVAIPNDPTNEARALLLLQKANLIGLRDGVTVYATPNDVIENPKQLKFVELDAAQLPRTLGDVAIAAINTTFAVPAGLSPKTALFAESSSSPYANLIVVRKNEMNNPLILNLVAAYHSPEVTAAAKKIFGPDAAIPAWGNEQFGS